MDNNMRPSGEPQKMTQQYDSVGDVLDLLDLWRVLMRQKWLILGGTFFCTTLVTVLVLSVPSEYRAEVVMLPPLAETVEKLNVPNFDDGTSKFTGYLFKVEPRELYNELIENLQSNHIQLQFFKENELFASLSSGEETRTNNEIFEKEFRAKLAVEGIKKNKKTSGPVTISFKGKRPEEITSWLNDFVSFVDKYTISVQTKYFLMKVQRQNDILLKRIENLRLSGKVKRLDMIIKLDEAVVVAREIGWLEQPDNIDSFYEKVNVEGGGVSFSLQEMPLYLRGANALQSEIDVLKQRKNNDPFTPRLRHLQEQLGFLSSVTQDTENVHTMRLDRAAIIDERPIKPKRKLIIALGFILSFILSVVVAFIKNRVVNCKVS